MRLLPLLAAAATLQSAHASDEQRFAELGRCELGSGEVIEDCRIGYRTLGTLNSARSNAIIFPTWYTGTSAELLSGGYAGPGKLADSERFFVILVDALGNGVSSSPSNSIPQPGARFPQYSIADMVATQYRLASEVLELERVHAVMGLSMGAMQTYEWMVAHPDYLAKAVPIEGTPWPTSHDMLLWHTWLLVADLQDETPAQVDEAIRILAALDALMLWTPEYLARTTRPSEYRTLLDTLSTSGGRPALMDRASQSRALLGHDIARALDARSSAAARVKAESFTIVFARDQMVRPGPAIELSEIIGGRLLVLDSDCGHMTPTEACEHSAVRDAVQAFLR